MNAGGPLPPNFAAAFDGLGRLAAVAIGFSIPISVAADNVLLALIAICFLGRGKFRQAWLAVRANTVFLAALALFGVLFAAAFYGPAAPGEAARSLLKYVELLFVPLVAGFFQDPVTRRRGLAAFAAALAVTLLLSFALHAGLISRGPLLVHDLIYPVAFKHSLTHTLLVAYGAFLFVQLGQAAQGTLRWLWYSLAAAAVMNIVFLVPGRTGYVALGALALYWGYSRWRWRGLLAMGAAALVTTAVVYGASDLFRARSDRALQEYSSWRPGAAAGDTDAVGLRLEFYRNSLAIFRDHPLIGVGTGSFPHAYAEQVKGSGMSATRNPHNQYLLFAVQTGAVGLLLFLHLLGQQWRLAARLPAPLETHLARGMVLTIAIGCLFNSLLLDHTEGLLYAWFTGLLYAGLQSKSTHDQPQ